MLWSLQTLQLSDLILENPTYCLVLQQSQMLEGRRLQTEQRGHQAPKTLATQEVTDTRKLLELPRSLLCFRTEPPSPRSPDAQSPLHAEAGIYPNSSFVVPHRQDQASATTKCSQGDRYPSATRIFECSEECTYFFNATNCHKNIMLPWKILFLLPVALLIAQKNFCFAI